MNYLCNPLNINYRYQFFRRKEDSLCNVSREAADPSMICHKGKYYLFASMTLGVFVSEDLVSWERHDLPTTLPLYDYAPDVRVIGEYVYFSASKRDQNCNFYRTKDLLAGPYEELSGSFPFWDPNLFWDDDGRVYFYWGCTNITPIYGVELDIKTMLPIGVQKELVSGDIHTKGFERIGEDHHSVPTPQEEIDEMVLKMAKAYGIDPQTISPEMREQAKMYFSDNPYIEGAWMDKYEDKYYLQYACPGTQYNTYADGVYVSDHPLGPFTPAKNNPYSYKPGGFLPGAGHGSTMWDLHQNLWHTATMRISMNHNFERRLGIWPAGFDADGELFCNQRYGDWPLSLDQGKQDPWADPKWFLLSYGKTVSCSSAAPGHGPALVADENVQTWWKAGTAQPGEWIRMDLGEVSDVHGVQINFADDKLVRPAPVPLQEDLIEARYIDEAPRTTRWILEGSIDGENYFTVADKSEAQTDLPHDFVLIEAGKEIRFLKLRILALPFSQTPCVSGLRVFGLGRGEKPEVPVYHCHRSSDLDFSVEISPNGATGYNILWGSSPEKLYHSYMVFGKNRQDIGALVKGESYFVRVDAFNEVGITPGSITEIPSFC